MSEFKRDECIGLAELLDGSMGRTQAARRVGVSLTLQSSSFGHLGGLDNFSLLVRFRFLLIPFLKEGGGTRLRFAERNTAFLYDDC